MGTGEGKEAGAGVGVGAEAGGIVICTADCLAEGVAADTAGRACA